MMKKYLTVMQAAELLQCSRGSIYNYIKHGRLKSSKPVHRLMIAQEDLEAFIEGTNLPSDPPLAPVTESSAVAKPTPPGSKNQQRRQQRGH